MPSTLEGAVVRLADIIAYLGKDRQDAMRAKIAEESMFFNEDIGSINAEIINNLVVNVIENSYGKPYIKMDTEHYQGMRDVKRRNYDVIYKSDKVAKVLDEQVRPIMHKLYYKLLSDLKNGVKSSPIYKHHVDFVQDNHYYTSLVPYLETEPNQIVVDYMASMTDDYCAELYHFLFPNDNTDIRYHGYFEDLTV